jgi:hypothetical protein
MRTARRVISLAITAGILGFLLGGYVSNTCSDYTTAQSFVESVGHLEAEAWDRLFCGNGPSAIKVAIELR